MAVGDSRSVLFTQCRECWREFQQALNESNDPWRSLRLGGENDFIDQAGAQANYWAL
jgi:hypothetical protein